MVDNPQAPPDVMPHEASRVPDRSGGNEESALESAARHLRASPRPAGSAPAREREILRGRQARDLLDWARENSCLIELALVSRLAEDGGEEHRVWFDDHRQLYFKTTHPGKFGFCVIAVSPDLPELVAATPLEYLDRLLLQNSLFGDSTKLEGVVLEENGMAVLTSQPNVTGGAATREEILAFMEHLWFRPIPGIRLGRPGALAFYRDLDEIAAFDAHPANFVKDEDGLVLPIDLILVGADAALQQALAHSAR